MGKHTVTAITRPDSKSKLPSGVEIKKVDYSSQESLVSALTGQEVLIITMAVTAPRDTEAKLIEAAAAAGVPYVFPNEWGVRPDAGADGDGHHERGATEQGPPANRLVGQERLDRPHLQLLVRV